MCGGVPIDVLSVKKSYIPRRSYTSYLNSKYAVGGLAFFIIIIITIIAVSVKKSSNDSLNSLNIILHSNGSLWRYDPTSNEFFLLKNTTHNITAFNRNCENEIFWIDKNTARIYSARIEESDSVENVRLIFENPRITPEAFAIDYISKKLYIVDNVLDVLLIVDMQTGQYVLPLADLSNPRDIQIDPETGHMFILQYYDSILAGAMDATSVRTIQKGEITAMALDYNTRKIYWLVDPGTILSCNYYGINTEVVLSKQVQITSLAISNNQLLWLSPIEGNADGFVWTCMVETKNCNHFKMHPLSLPNVNLIKSFTDCRNASVNNPCQFQNSRCEQLCLLSTNEKGRHSCACQLGMQLTSNFRTCKNITEFMLYIRKDFVRGCLLNVKKDSFDNTILPTPLRNISLINKDTIDFDYDIRTGDFYFSDDKNIYKINLKNFKDQTIIRSCDNPYVIEDLAFDWHSENLYYSQCSTTIKNNHSFSVLNMKMPRTFHRTLMSFSYLDHFGLNACPYATVIHSKLGYIFFSAGDVNIRKIFKLSLNGTVQFFEHPAEGVQFGDHHKLLAVDHEKDLLYRLSRVIPLQIDVANMTGTRVSSYRLGYLLMSPIDQAKSIDVKGQYVYLSDDVAVWQFDLYDDANKIIHAHKVTPPEYVKTNFKISSIKIYDSVRQSSYKNNPCAFENGGCDQFCFSSPVKSCGCSDGMQFSNGHCT